MRFGTLHYDAEEELYIITLDDSVQVECYCGMPIEALINNAWLKTSIQYDADNNTWFLEGIGEYLDSIQIRI